VRVVRHRDSDGSGRAGRAGHKYGIGRPDDPPQSARTGPDGFAGAAFAVERV